MRFETQELFLWCAQSLFAVSMVTQRVAPIKMKCFAFLLSKCDTYIESSVLNKVCLCLYSAFWQTSNHMLYCALVPWWPQEGKIFKAGQGFTLMPWTSVLMVLSWDCLQSGLISGRLETSTSKDWQKRSQIESVRLHLNRLKPLLASLTLQFLISWIICKLFDGAVQLLCT